MILLYVWFGPNIHEINLVFFVRTVLLLSTLLTSGLGLLSALSINYLCLLVLRFFVGIGVGSGHVFSSWFLEFVPAGNRGTWMVIFSFFWTIGTVLEASLAWVWHFAPSLELNGFPFSSYGFLIGHTVYIIFLKGMLLVSCRDNTLCITLRVLLSLILCRILFKQASETGILFWNAPCHE